MAIELDVQCKECRNGLQANLRTTNYGMAYFIEVDPCGACLEKARAEGREEAEE